ncbi:MAG: WYL domain-containing protein, partial [Myxococcales bacterium]|nr:WYL domain-containing protein [Myxococcales bacterium]
VVHIDYVNGDGTMTRDRPVEPMALARTRHHWHLLGWCRLREGPRWFRTDRVMRAHLTHEVAPPRDLGATFGEPPDDARPIELG